MQNWTLQVRQWQHSAEFMYIRLIDANVTNATQSLVKTGKVFIFVQYIKRDGLLAIYGHLKQDVSLLVFFLLRSRII